MMEDMIELETKKRRKRKTKTQEVEEADVNLESDESIINIENIIENSISSSGIDTITEVKEEIVSKSWPVYFKHNFNSEVFYVDFGPTEVSGSFGKIEIKYAYHVKKGIIQKMICDTDVKYLIRGKEIKEDFVFDDEKIAKEYTNKLNNGK